MFPGHGDYFSCRCPAVAAVAQTLTQIDDSVVLSRVTGCYRVLLISEGFLTILLLFRVGSDFGVSSSQTNLSISIRPFTPHRRPIPPEDFSKTQKHFNFLSCSEKHFGSNPLVSNINVKIRDLSNVYASPPSTREGLFFPSKTGGGIRITTLKHQARSWTAMKLFSNFVFSWIINMAEKSRGPSGRCVGGTHSNNVWKLRAIDKTSIQTDCQD